ncbi:MAG: helix-turn-helix domain-containing protein [Erysipelotrichaceae bacterium]|nr:helix-turn-helix domain-containing protein [Erysipelotrichaceae bacterium]
MEDLKQIIAQNLVELRKRKKYTQLDLANILQYSDKSISKWEKGDSLPDIEVLYQICNLYGVTLDYLTHEGSYEEKKEFVVHESYGRNKLIIVGLIVSLIWFLCILVFAYSLVYLQKGIWPILVWGVPLSFLILLIFNSLWGKRKWKFGIIPCFIWTLITAFFLQILYIGQNVWPVFLLGIPPQIAIILWSQMKH